LPLQSSIGIPSLDLLIEYQGEQHFLPFEHWGGEVALESQQRRDAEKRVAAKMTGLTLIEVHYSWDFSEKAIREQLSHFIPMPS